jgi:hypothetical protein
MKKLFLTLLTLITLPILSFSATIQWSQFDAVDEIAKYPWYNSVTISDE